MIGDSAPDMEAGRRAGVKTCGVRYGYGDISENGRICSRITGSTTSAQLIPVEVGMRPQGVSDEAEA